MATKVLVDTKTLPRTLKICLVCGCEYHNAEHSKKLSNCPNCNVHEIEHITFKYVFQQISYDEEVLPSSPDVGCDVATAFQFSQSLCYRCPFPTCLAELHFRWCYYAKNKERVKRGWNLIDRGLQYREVANNLHVPISFITAWQLERIIIEPIYQRFKHKRLTSFKGPKSL